MPSAFCLQCFIYQIVAGIEQLEQTLSQCDKTLRPNSDRQRTILNNKQTLCSIEQIFSTASIKVCLVRIARAGTQIITTLAEAPPIYMAYLTYLTQTSHVRLTDRFPPGAFTKISRNRRRGSNRQDIYTRHCQRTSRDCNKQQHVSRSQSTSPGSQVSQQVVQSSQSQVKFQV